MNERRGYTQPDKRFLGKPADFWAQVRFFSERLGYSRRGSGELKVYTQLELLACAHREGFELPDVRAQALCEYVTYRADVLNNRVQRDLMDRQEAEQRFDLLKQQLKPRCNLPYNKQKGSKRHPAFMTGIVNMLTENALSGRHFDDDPRNLIVFSRNRAPMRTLARRMDGAYPSTHNPAAIWEIKEYYGTTTFGSRVADGVYETQLDGWELADLVVKENVPVSHYLIVDDRFTWWDCGRSYLCRIVDMLHMGLLDEVLFGREVIRRWPEIVRSWGA